MIPEFLGSLALPVCRLERCGKKPPLPARQTEDAAGVDLAAFLPEGELVIPAGGRVLVPTGLTMAVPPGWGGFRQDREGAACLVHQRRLAGLAQRRPFFCASRRAL